MRVLCDFLEKENAFKTAKEHDKMHFVGYTLELNYNEAIVITSDPFKLAVGGIPRNSMLIMVPTQSPETPYFVVLRVLDGAPTPLAKEMQETYFELQKRDMPELDIFTSAELQWGALKTEILGMFYMNPDEDKVDEVEFSADLNNYESAHKYVVYAPNEALLDMMVNAMVPATSRFTIGKLRRTECRYAGSSIPAPNVDVSVSTDDFIGARTAMFGKTRLGKSNAVKKICESIIVTTKDEHDVGQLIFDINGEYANDNPQDENRENRELFRVSFIEHLRFRWNQGHVKILKRLLITLRRYFCNEIQQVLQRQS